jgi:hypothetical protein
MNPIDSAFEALRTTVVDAVRPPAAEEIVARGRRRRTVRVVAAAVAVVAVIASGAFLTGSPKALPHPAASPTVRPGPTGARSAMASIPRGFLVKEETAAERGDGDVQSGSCQGAPALSAGTRQENGRTSYFQDLYVYADEQAARAAFRRTRADLAGCFGFPDARVKTAQTAPTWGDEAAAITLKLPADGANEYTGAPLRLVAVRVGTALATFWGYPEVPGIDRDARTIVSRLCYYDPSCQPPADSPRPVTVHAGDTVWSAVLDEYQADDDAARPGLSVAAAAEHGYHPDIVRAECDGGTAGQLRVVLYFAGRTDAERFTKLVPASVTEVRIGCDP